MFKSAREGSFAKLSTASVLLLLSLSACTASKPPNFYLPPASSLVRGEKITVARGENVYALSQKYGVNMRDLIALNELEPPFVLRSGQTLYLPSKDKYAAPTPVAAPLDHIDKGALGPSSTSVISTSSAVQSVELAPPPKPVASAAASSSASSAPANMPFATVKDEPPPSSVAPAPSSASASAPTDIASASASGESSTSASDFVPSFTWPVRGTIISAFGPKGKGRDNDGINIAAPKGAPVKAAEGGMVAYAGNEMKGFGNLVLIRHEGGWVTAYAHMDRVVVSRDTIVAKGDMIGSVGTTGGVSSPQLHFEVRREGKPTDPELVLK